MSDKLIGPKVKIVLSKFLPAIFMDAMRDNASASVHMFEGEASRPLSQGTCCGDMTREHVTVHCYYNNAVLPFNPLRLHHTFLPTLLAYCPCSMHPRVHTKGSCLSTLHAPAICPLVCADLLRNSKTSHNFVTLFCWGRLHDKLNVCVGRQGMFVVTSPFVTFTRSVFDLCFFVVVVFFSV